MEGYPCQIVKPDTLDKYSGLEPIWLGKGITSYDNNKNNEMYGKFKIEWWEPISPSRGTKKDRFKDCWVKQWTKRTTMLQCCLHQKIKENKLQDTYHI